jgi:hypothetical protein
MDILFAPAILSIVIAFVLPNISEMRRSANLYYTQYST